MTGYGSAEYAASLAEVGRPRPLPASGAWILERPISGAGARDATGCYPLFLCRDWCALAYDLNNAMDGLVSLVLVTDPFADIDASALARLFPDACRPFKEHWCVDLGAGWHDTVSAHHRRNVRYAARTLVAEPCDDPASHSDDWLRLYASLIDRHRVRGVARFSPASLVAQLQVPGLLAFRARDGQRTVGMMLWYRTGGVAYYHLAAYDDIGYSARASFLLMWESLEHLQRDVEFATLGAAAGDRDDQASGLARFKRGWSNTRRKVFLCGRVFDREAYTALVVRHGTSASAGYFPAYRAGSP